VLLTRRFALTTGGAAAILAGCATPDPIRADGSVALLVLLGAQPDLSEFRGALTRANLNSMLEGDGPFTLLAPTNAAWANAPQAIKDANPDAIRNLIARGRLRRRDIQARNGRIRMLGGIDVRVVGGTPEQPRIQAAAAGGQPSGPSGSIARPDLLARNGVIQVVDAILVPQS
jgi:hypothetical protein